MNINIKVNEMDVLIFSDELDWKQHKAFLYGICGSRIPKRDPERFPCIAASAGETCDPYGPDIVQYVFFYDFEVIP